MPAPPKPERFQWPPRGDATGSEPRWQVAQPRILREAAKGDSLDSDAPSSSHWTHVIEAAWLGVTRASLAVRFAAAGWRPDTPSMYCGRCGTSVGAYESDDTGCPVCRGLGMSWDRFVRVGAYEGLIREAVHELKFTAWRSVGYELGQWLGHSLAEAVAGLPQPPARVILVPVPSTWWRRMIRGVDHTLTLCRGVRDVTGWPIARVLRRRWRPTQVGLPISKRRANVRGAFYPCGGGSWLPGDLIVVVDDVRTTGATLTEACRIVDQKRLGVRQVAVWAAAVGVTGDGSRQPVELRVEGD